ncbi:guanylin-like [Lissotriton helveticus]
MKYFLLLVFPACLMMMMMMQTCQAVYVKDGDLTFPLESVKKLKELLLEVQKGSLDETGEHKPLADKIEEHINPLHKTELAEHRREERAAEVNVDFVKVCTHPELPKEFSQLCKKGNAPAVMERLMFAIRNADVCEVCASAACAGC